MSSDYFDARVRTTEPAEALEWLRTQYGRVDVQSDAGTLAERAAGDDAFALRRLSWGCRAEVVYEADRFFFATSTPGYTWRIGSVEGEYSVAPGIVQPGQELLGRADGTVVEMVAFDAAHLTEAARVIYGDDSLEVRFDGTAPVSPRLRDYWLATLRWSLTQLPLLSEPLVRAHVRRAIVAATLEAFPLAGDPRERRASALEQAAIYAAATSWMDDHASLPVTADDAARAVGTSAAGLRRAFAANAHLAVTPEAYLAQARVSAAHADLVASDPTRSSVAEIALRWGFVDVLAFVAVYRAAYRTDPQVTLER
ncbi:helix-turn-helix domain-containing protein [Microbacterium sp. B19]|uniref:helix-turn-helix transcriptional regulator n=1 Tax=Microbacterium sp. B19 TaxID=96765 RepID=UPI0003484822|nr:helix-turn-helix domain-containing protein [Microbacterium sp. B19]